MNVDVTGIVNLILVVLAIGFLASVYGSLKSIAASLREISSHLSGRKTDTADSVDSDMS